MKYVILISLFVLSGCERINNLTNQQITDWFEAHQTYIDEIVEIVDEYSLEGEVFAEKENNRQLQGTYYSNINKAEVLSRTSELLKILGLDSIYINRNVKLESIYIDLYLEGFCMAFGNCKQTHILYLPDSNNRIFEEKYVYFPLPNEGWYILKID